MREIALLSSSIQGNGDIWCQTALNVHSMWKCCIQYASKFGKLSSGHRAGIGQFSFQSLRKAMSKNAQSTAQLHSSHTLVMEKEMATHSSVLAWRIPGTDEPSGLPSMGLHRVGHDWSDLAAAAAVPKLCPTSVIPWTVALQAHLSLGFSRQEYWSGLPFPSPGDHPNPGIKPRSPALKSDSLPYEPTRKTWYVII